MSEPAATLLRRLVAEGRSSRDTRDFFGDDSLVIAAFDRRTWKEAIAFVDTKASSPAPQPLDVERLGHAIHNRTDPMQAKCYCGRPFDCVTAKSVLARLGSQEGSE